MRSHFSPGQGAYVRKLKPSVQFAPPGQYYFHLNQSLRKRSRCTRTCLNNSETIPKLISKKHVACRKKFIISKTKTYHSQKTRVVRFEPTRKIHENISNSPVAFIAGLYKAHVVMWSKLAEVHAKKEN